MDPYAWSADPDVLVLVPAALAAYALAARKWPTERRRVAAFVAALALVLATHVSPLAALSNGYLLCMHLLQNVVLAEWAPGLAVLGLSTALAARIASLPGVGTLTRPLIALPLWLGTYFVWHLPWAYDAALEHQDTLLHVEHGCYFAAGCLLWWPVIHDRPWRLRSGAKAVYLFGAFVLASPLGLLLALLPNPIYDFYEAAPRLWGLSPLADQQIAGVTMAAEQAVVFFVLCTLYFGRFLREEESREAFRAVPRS